jgi:hypothetical protein
VAVFVEAELFVLGADPPCVARLGTRFQIGGKLAGIVDGRGVGGIARHGVSLKSAGP